MSHEPLELHDAICDAFCRGINFIHPWCTRFFGLLHLLHEKLKKPATFKFLTKWLGFQRKVEKWWLYTFHLRDDRFWEEMESEPFRFSLPCCQPYSSRPEVLHSFPHTNINDCWRSCSGWCPGFFTAPSSQQLSNPIFVSDCQCCDEAGRKSPVELSSSFPPRLLLTVLLLVDALAWQPGFGVPLDNVHTHKQTQKERDI